MFDEIIVEIDKDGSVTVSVRGMKGSGCRALTKDLEKALGRTVEDHATRELTEQPQRQKVRQ
jgi:Protein of unknown function (DUF2997)